MLKSGVDMLSKITIITALTIVPITAYMIISIKLLKNELYFKKYVASNMIIGMNNNK